MSNPFHLSFVVPKLRDAEEFYVEFLGCKKGRDTGSWIDVIFYGHQLTLHQETDKMPAKPIDHFGVILTKEEWLSLHQKFEEKGDGFVLAPNKMIQEDKSESGKFIIKDPANNLVEFKFYKESPTKLAS